MEISVLYMGRSRQQNHHLMIRMLKNQLLKNQQ
jgi:hypothetical protein